MKQKVSPEVASDAMKLAKRRQSVGQTKEQTKIIAQGIQKGIAEYKKQQNSKLRALDKQRKQRRKQQEATGAESDDTSLEMIVDRRGQLLPWILLGLSWLGFAAYMVWQNY